MNWIYLAMGHGSYSECINPTASLKYPWFISVMLNILCRKPIKTYYFMKSMVCLCMSLITDLINYRKRNQIIKLQRKATTYFYIIVMLCKYDLLVGKNSKKAGYLDNVLWLIGLFPWIAWNKILVRSYNSFQIMLSSIT